ncbi:MAG TPA: MarR family transcriptional regulator [Gaiellaceae bacterium]|nr:MarR family transcriptional regulator [Gaiellaceae bacterium]
MSREATIQQLIAEHRAQQVATDALDQAVADHLGINRTDQRALDVLDQRGRLTAGELAEAMHLTSGAVTTVVDRLEKRGLAKRVRDPDDRRRVLVECSPKLARVGAEFYGAEEVPGFFDDYSDEQLALLLEFVRRSRAWTEQRVANAQARTRDRKGRNRLRGRGRA